MTAAQIIAAFKALPAEGKAEVINAILAEDESWVPESFRRGMEDFEQGRVVPMEVALTQKPPSKA